MVLLYDRFLFRSYHHLYKITDTKTNIYIYEKKEVFNSPVNLIIDRSTDKYHYVTHINDKISEFNISINKYVEKMSDLKKLCKKFMSYKSLFFNDRFMKLKIPNQVKYMIHKLNHKLNQKCNGFNLLFDYGYKIKDNNLPLTSYVLCLYYDTKCLSTILCTIIKNIFYINSNTIESYQRNKYNLFLRSTAIIICKYYNISSLQSDAINPISVYTLSKYFMVTYDDDFKKFLNHRPITLEICQEYMNDDDIGVTVNVHINDENIQRALNVCKELLDGKLNCP